MVHQVKLSEVDKVLRLDIEALFDEFGPLGVKNAVEMLYAEETKKVAAIVPQAYWAIFRAVYGKQLVPYRKQFPTLDEAYAWMKKHVPGGGTGVITPTGRLHWTDREGDGVEGKLVNTGLMEHHQEIFGDIPVKMPKSAKFVYATTAEKAKIAELVKPVIATTVTPAAAVAALDSVLGPEINE